MTPGRDLLVVGGGPVGLYAAIEAATAGLDVAVLEARPGILDKACGEGLMPAAVSALERAGVRIERKFPFLGIRYVEGASRAEGTFSDGPGWGVRRTELHRALTERMRQLAVPVIAQRVQQIEQDREGVTVDGMRTRYVLACDGLRSGIRRRLELEDPPRHRAKRYGLRQHFRVRPWSDLVEVHWQELGEAYVTPVAEDEVGVAMLFDERSLAVGAPSMDELLARFPELVGRLGGATPCSTVRGAGPFEQRAKRVVEGRVMLAGDAAGYLDPITGEGLRLGFVAAVAAVDAIARGRVPAYEATWRLLVRRYWWSTTALLALRRSPLRRLMMPALCRIPSLFDSILDSLGGTDEPVPGEARRTVHTPA